MVAPLLGVLGALGKFLAALAGGGLRVVALGGPAPILDLLLLRGLGSGIRRRERVDLHRIGSDADFGGADGLGLEKRPEVRRLDVGAERIGLRALAERLGERQEQRE